MVKTNSYCGLDCDECIMGDGKTYTFAEGLLKNMDKCSLDQWQEQVPREEEFDYASLRKGLKWMTRFKCDGCKSGGGNPECNLRKCAQKKGMENCGACAELPCTIIEEWKAQGIDITHNFR